MNLNSTKLLAALTFVIMSSPACHAAPQNQITANFSATIPSNSSLVCTSGGGNSAVMTLPANSNFWQISTNSGAVYTTAPVTSNLTCVTNSSRGCTVNIRASAGPTVSNGDSRLLSKFRVRLINAVKIQGPGSWKFTPRSFNMSQITGTAQPIGSSDTQGSFSVDLAIDVPSSSPISAEVASAGAQVSATFVLTTTDN